MVLIFIGDYSPLHYTKQYSSLHLSYFMNTPEEVYNIMVQAG